jgi:hypothetical protein
VVQAVEGSQPEIALAARGGIDAVLATAIIAAITAVVGTTAASLGQAIR